MSETPQSPPEGAKETYVHDADVARELAEKTDSLETERAQNLGAVAVVGDAYITGEKPMELIDRTIEEEKAKHSVVEEVDYSGGWGAIEEAVPTSPVGRSAMKAKQILYYAEKSEDPDVAYSEVNKSAAKRIEELNRDIESVHETGLTIEQQAKKAKVVSDIADLRKL